MLLGKITPETEEHQFYWGCRSLFNISNRCVDAIVRCWNSIYHSFAPSWDKVNQNLHQNVHNPHEKKIIPNYEYISFSASMSVIALNHLTESLFLLNSSWRPWHFIGMHLISFTVGRMIIKQGVFEYHQDPSREQDRRAIAGSGKIIGGTCVLVYTAVKILSTVATTLFRKDEIAAFTAVISSCSAASKIWKEMQGKRTLEIQWGDQSDFLSSKNQLILKQDFSQNNKLRDWLTLVTTEVYANRKPSIQARKEVYIKESSRFHWLVSLRHSLIVENCKWDPSVNPYPAFKTIHMSQPFEKFWLTIQQSPAAKYFEKEWEEAHSKEKRE